STDRMVNELLLIMEEPRAGAMLAMLEKLGVLRAIHPDLCWPYRDDSQTGKLEGPHAPTPRQRHDTYLAILGAEFAGDPDEAERLGRDLGLGAHHVTLMRDAALLAERWPKLSESELAPSQVYNLLHGLDVKTLQAFTRIRA